MEHMLRCAQGLGRKLDDGGRLLWDCANWGVCGQLVWGRCISASADVASRDVCPMSPEHAVFLKIFLLSDFRETEEGREREQNIDFMIHHWLILVCARTGDRTYNLGYQDDAPTT